MVRQVGKSEKVFREPRGQGRTLCVGSPEDFGADGECEAGARNGDSEMQSSTGCGGDGRRRLYTGSVQVMRDLQSESWGDLGCIVTVGRPHRAFRLLGLAQSQLLSSFTLVNPGTLWGEGSLLELPRFGGLTWC